MQVPDRTPTPTEALVSALRSFYRAYQKSRIYPSGHPSIPLSIGEAVDRFHEAFDGSGPIVLGVARDHFFRGDLEIAETTGTLHSLALLLHDLDVAAVEIQPGLEREELEKVAVQLGRARLAGLRGAELTRAVLDDGVERLRLAPIDYRALSFCEGAPGGGSAERRRDVWVELSRSLTDPASFASGDSPESVAGRISNEVFEREGTGIGDLRAELGRQVTCLRDLPDDQRSLVRQRLSGFLAALDPELRRSLLRIGPGDSVEALALIGELADDLPDADLVDGLQSVDRAGGEVPEELVILLGKLVRISRSRPALASSLEETLERWGVPADVLAEGTMSLRRAVEEVFQRRSHDDYNPEEYRSLLGGLSRERLEPIATADGAGASALPSRARYRDPLDATETRMHAAEIGVLLLGRTGGGTLRAATLGFVAERTDLLLDHQRVTPVLEATIAARADKLLADSPPAVRTAATGYLTDFSGGERIARILDAVCADTEIRAEALRLLELGGAAALHAVLDRLARDVPPSVEDCLRNFAAVREPEQWAQVLAERARIGWRSLRTAFPILRTMPADVAVPLFQRLFADEEPLIRREALSALCDLDRYSSPERYPRRALCDGDPRVVATAVERLGKLETPESLELLGAFVGGRLRGTSRTPECCRLAVVALAGRAEAGGEQLAAALGALCANLRPREAWIATSVAAALASCRSSPAIRHALLRWKLSPARLVSRLTRRGRS